MCCVVGIEHGWNADYAFGGCSTCQMLQANEDANRCSLMMTSLSGGAEVHGFILGGVEFNFVGGFRLRPFSYWAPLLLPLLVFSAGVGSVDEMLLPFAAR
ncbi:hypothetical protein Nepgr_007941 [Nepenthes gracilis]|uniref:Uncharacterized protein n=1 Tax=Nepenthes gracilis TaxID=150966 RepID=A0AAD3S868_NEPGR|nr:hypothetical protein Nepgr_007941 [Nepenthes gracilis]